MEVDLTYFDKEDLFPSQGFRLPEERVHALFRRVYSLSPLEILIRRDEKDELKSRGHQLQKLCRAYLPAEEYDFLVEQLGLSFGTILKMPLEFRDFTRESFIEYFKENLEKFRERIKIVREVAGLNGYKGRVNGQVM